MSELKIVLYNNNRSPRSVALTTRLVYKTLALAVLGLTLLLISMGLAIRFYIVSKEKVAQTNTSHAEQDVSGPTNSPEEQTKALRDEVDRLQTKIKNQEIVQASAKHIDSANPALGLFTPNVVDKTKNNDDSVIAKNFKYSQTKDRANLTFELHNAHPGDSTQKGYIVVLARSAKSLKAYPDVFNAAGPYLLDFEKGETFQVARFRLVNAQFDMDDKPENFQVLIFTRNGELLINSKYDAKNGN